MCLKPNNTPLFFAAVISLFLFTYGCRSGSKHKEKDQLDRYHTRVELHHATGFYIDKADDHTRVTILNPWLKNKEPYAVYYLYTTLPDSLPTDGVCLQTPVRSLIVNSFPYLEFLSLLDETNSIKGVSDGFRVYNPEILGRLAAGTIQDMGDPFQPNPERVMTVKPDAVINSAYAQRDNYSERLIEAGIPIIYSLEWMEQEPLARAEWIRMIAAFVNKEELADSIYFDIEKRYHQIREKVSHREEKASVLAGDNFQDTWYLPGGKSFNAAFFRDAGLAYRYGNNKESGSIGLDIESVLTQFSKAQFWFGCEADSYAELAEKDAKYLLLDAVKNRQVFSYRNRITPEGGNDYFESAVSRPDLVLSDMIRAAYPDLLPNHTFTYIKPLKEEPFRE